MVRFKLQVVLAAILLLLAGYLLIRSYWPAHAQQQYRVLDTTRAQFLGQEPGALGSTSSLTFTAISQIDDGEVELLPLGIVGDWETLPSPLLPRPVELAAAVIYAEGQPPFRQRIYLVGGYDTTPPAKRLDSVYTCDVHSDGSLSEWTLQAEHLPKGIASAGIALSTQDAWGNPIAPTIYLLGGRLEGDQGGRSSLIYYAHIDPVTLDIEAWQTATVELGGPRVGLSAVANDGYLYAIGGYDGLSTYSSAVWHFSLDSSGAPTERAVEWGLPGDPNNNPNSMYHRTLLITGHDSYPTDTLYIIGGRNSTSSTNQVLRGDIAPPDSPEPGFITWRTVTGNDLPEALSSLAVVVGDLQNAGRQAYVVGGDQGVDGGNPQNTIRSAAINDEDNSFYNWYGGVWLTSPALPSPRFYHTVVQAGDYIYAIAGHGEGSTLYRDTLRGRLTGEGAWQFAPSGGFLSRVVDLGRKYRLMSFDWTGTITPTDPGVNMTLQFRAGNEPDLSDAAGGWSDLFTSTRGVLTKTVVDAPHLTNFPFYPPIARYVQYRALLTTTAAYSNVTPMLHEVGVHVEDGPDLVVSNVKLSCDGCYGTIGLISKTMELSITMFNAGGSVPPGNNFYTALFITTAADYAPAPPDLPTMQPRFLPGSTYWALWGSQFASGQRVVVNTTLYFTQPQALYLYAYVDYNDTGTPPDYDVGESDPDNNLTVLAIVVLDPNAAAATQTAWYWQTQTAIPAVTQTPSAIVHRAYMPMVVRNYSPSIYLPLLLDRGATRMVVPTPTPSPGPPSVGPPLPGDVTPAALPRP